MSYRPRQVPDSIRSGARPAPASADSVEVRILRYPSAVVNEIVVKLPQYLPHQGRSRQFHAGKMVVRRPVHFCDHSDPDPLPLPFRCLREGEGLSQRPHHRTIQLVAFCPAVHRRLWGFPGRQRNFEQQGRFPGMVDHPLRCVGTRTEFVLVRPGAAKMDDRPDPPASLPAKRAVEIRPTTLRQYPP